MVFVSSPFFFSLRTCRYGGGPEIICDVIKTVFIMRSLEPDLYPLELQVYRSSAMQDPISVQAKKSMTIAELRDLVSFIFFNESFFISFSS